jgi:transposase
MATVERPFKSLKNLIRIRPARCWSENGIYGAFLIAFLAKLMVPFLRFRCQDLKTGSTKYIMRSLMNFSLTVVFLNNGRRRIFLELRRDQSARSAENTVVI